MTGMKRVLIPLILIGTVVFGSCDMFRKLAGRPTKEELRKIERMMEEEQRHQAVLDSLTGLQKA